MIRILSSLAVVLSLALPTLAAELGDDGLHKTDWMRDTFKDLREDLAEANAEGKRLALMIEQRGCIYCTQMHEDIYPVAEIDQFIRDTYFVVQINMFGGIEVVDFDGETLTEKDAVKKWGVFFTPTVMFFPEEVADGLNAAQASVVQMPGAFGKSTTLNMYRWVAEKGYEGEESFQKYHARVFNAGMEWSE